jgi:hypothetical protein
MFHKLITKKMIIAKNTPFFFHSLRGEKSALILVKKPGVFSGTPVYVARDLVAGMEPGDVARLQMDYTAVPWIVDGEARTAKNGQQLLILQ